MINLTRITHIMPKSVRRLTACSCAYWNVHSSRIRCAVMIPYGFSRTLFVGLATSGPAGWHYLPTADYKPA